MGYLITKDYLRIIQPTELNAITSNDTSIRQLVEGSTMVEMHECLMQRYDIDKEFADITAWSYSIAYKGGQRVYLDATAYSIIGLYPLHSLTLYQSNVYINISAIALPEAWTSAHWQLLGVQYDLFYVTLPKTVFDADTYYYINDSVFWNDKVYIAITESTPLTQQALLQAPAIEQVSKGNVVPGSKYGYKMWGNGTAFTLTAGTLPISTGWTKGDNRNQHFVEIMMDIVVYKLCKRIAPNNVPEARHNAWVKANEDIKAFGNGKRNAQLPTIQPKTGQRVRYGGTPREINTW